MSDVDKFTGYYEKVRYGKKKLSFDELNNASKLLDYIKRIIFMEAKNAYKDR
ncbi:MAG: hypothetical protein QME45_05300 [Clostridiales bacterium]|nr:hypothetical protein [Clostridiales bacterium]